MAAMSRFPPVSAYDASARERRTAASDLDGTLLASSSAFPYYFLVALEAGGYLRALALLLLAPFILLLYTAVSEPAAIGLLVFATFAGLRVRDVEAVARGVLPRHYTAGVRVDSWEVFKACGAGRRVVVTASPAVMVAPFVREFLGAEVAGTELGTCCGRFTGMISGGALVAGRKREVVERLFAGGDMPDVGLGDRESDHDFMAVCKIPTLQDGDGDLLPTPSAKLEVWLEVESQLHRRGGGGKEHRRSRQAAGRLQAHLAVEFYALTVDLAS